MKAPAVVVLLSVLYLYVHADTVGGDTDCNVDQDRTDHLIQSLKGCTNALQSSCTPEAESNCLSKEEMLYQLDEQAKKITKLQESVDNITEMLRIQQPSRLPTSCQDIATQWPNSSSGVYLIASASGSTHYVYCPFTTLCGSEGWTRVAYLNMSGSSAACPNELQLLQSNDGVRGCGRKSSNTASCNGLTFPSTDISYSEVCGRVIGYQIGSTDAVNTNFGGGDNDINSHYVDGVSITRGSPRQHVWTFMAGLQENYIYYDGRFECPCSNGSTQTVQSFIGDSYFCEAGTPGRWDHTTFRSQDPLWNGKECGAIETECCEAPGIPWFHKVIGSPTTDSIEMRVCCDQSTGDENVAVGLVEIYVK